jgi:hypothetical protein
MDDLPSKLMKTCKGCGLTLDVFAFKTRTSYDKAKSFQAAVDSFCFDCSSKRLLEYQRNNRDKVRASVNACDKKNKSTYNEVKKRHYYKLKNLVFSHYGYVCSCCGETEPRFLTIEHKNKDGAAHRKATGASGVYRDIVRNNYPDSFEILCWNCNCSQKFGEPCPHKFSTLRVA